VAANATLFYQSCISILPADEITHPTNPLRSFPVWLRQAESQAASSEHQERATYPTPNVLPDLAATRDPHRRYPPTPVTVRSDTYAGQKMLTRKTEQKKVE
jgi:hypothetical protein